MVKFSIVTLITLLSNLLQANDISISKLLGSYSLKETINYTILNNDRKRLFVRISVDAKVNGQWQEIINDATNPKNIAAVLYNLPGMSNKQFKLNLSELNYFHLKQSTLTIRLNVHYREIIDGKEKSTLSSAFEVK